MNAPTPSGGSGAPGDLSDGPIDEIDLAALGDVRRVFEGLDPVPDGLADRSRFAITMHALEAELAELMQPEARELALTRRDEVARAESVTFTSSTLQVMVTITVLGPSEGRVDGWTTVPAATARLHLDDGTDLVEQADDSGRFAFPAVPRGSVRLVVTPPGDGNRPVLTPPFEV